MRGCTRRALNGLAAATCLAPLAGRAAVRAAPRQPVARVVVIGGGAGGATVARYLAMMGPALDITLIEPKRRFSTCFFSNLYLAGLRSFESLTHGYETLTDRYGIRVVHEQATGIDPVGKFVSLGGGGRIAYDRLVVAPGIAFKDGAIAGYDEAAMQVMPHAWMAGTQTQLLRRQLEAMPDGGVFVITAPVDPFRCPPGPYERASLVASYFQQRKPRSKVLILDAKDTFFEQNLFEEAWNRHYGGMIEWLPAQFIGAIESVDAKARSVRTTNETFKADVANIIPPQMAASLAQQTGLADATGWCPVDPVRFESTRARDVHLVGDASSAGAMPKSAFAANSQAKACAVAIAAALTDSATSRPFLFNTCYTFLGPDDAVSDAISFKPTGGTIAIAALQVSSPDESAAVRAQAALQADGWYEAFTHDMFG